MFPVCMCTIFLISFCFVVCFPWLLTFLIVVHQNDLIEHLNDILNIPENFHPSMDLQISLTPLHCTVLFSNLLLYFLVFQDPKVCNIYIKFWTILACVHRYLSYTYTLCQHKLLPCYLLFFEFRNSLYSSVMTTVS